MIFSKKISNKLKLINLIIKNKVKKLLKNVIFLIINIIKFKFIKINFFFIYLFFKYEQILKILNLLFFKIFTFILFIKKEV